ncbi:MAG TPA: phosphoribosylglycinamide synthetase C domain-containing protein, partial [Gaiellaceae bacterium]|nr:phosphoribosylglycinamide synthetase C domain-containing protein [Gaiellaceae bacterium]
FNCRFGDPETQSILPRLEGDLLPLLWGAATGELEGEAASGDEAAVTVVLAAGGYPEHNDTGTPIDGIDDAESAGALLFHAGTASRDGVLVTNGGRIVGITATGDDVSAARDLVYAAVEQVSFSGMRFRHDIALAAAHEGVRG